MDDARHGACWHRQPVVWLGVLILALSLAGCVLLIVLAVRHADAPIPSVGGNVMKIPLARAGDAAHAQRDVRR